MNFFTELRTWFIWAVNLCVDVAIDCYNSPLLPDFLGDFFRDLSDVFSAVATYLYDGAQWWEYVEEQIAQIFTWPYLQDLIRSWLPDIEGLVAWFSDWWDRVLAVIETWWESAGYTVQAWIDAAVQPFNDLLEAWSDFINNVWPYFTELFNDLNNAWSAFLSNTLPDLVSFDWLASWWTSTIGEVQALIDSAFQIREDFWAGWQEIRNQVLEFFTDPWSWLYDRLDDFIERVW